MHLKKRQHVSPESRRNGEKDQGPVIKVVWVNDGLSRALRLFKVRILSLCCTKTRMEFLRVLG